MRCCVSFKRTVRKKLSNSSVKMPMPTDHLAGHSRERALNPRPTLPPGNCIRLVLSSRINLAASKRPGASKPSEGLFCDSRRSAPCAFSRVLKVASEANRGSSTTKSAIRLLKSERTDTRRKHFEHEESNTGFNPALAVPLHSARTNQLRPHPDGSHLKQVHHHHHRCHAGCVERQRVQNEQRRTHHNHELSQWRGLASNHGQLWRDENHDPEQRQHCDFERRRHSLHSE